MRVTGGGGGGGFGRGSRTSWVAFLERLFEADVMHTTSSLARLDDLARHVQPITRKDDHRLPVHPALVPLLPTGLQRGHVIAVDGSTSLMLLLVAAASTAGAWIGVVGLPGLGIAAAADLGVAVNRLALVPDPGQHWPAAVVAMLEGTEIIVLGPPARPSRASVRRLVALARQRAVPLVIVGGWPDPPDLHLAVTSSRWYGIEQVGFLQARRVEVTARGRGAASRPRRAALWLPGPDGRVAPANASADPPDLCPFPLPHRGSWHTSEWSRQVIAP